MRKSTWLSSICLVVGVCAVPGVALAGAHYATSVWFVTPQNVWGTVPGVRYSSNTTEYIGCEQYANAGQSVSASCSAQSANGTYLSCYTEDPSLVAIAGRVTSISAIQFGADAKGNCSFITLDNGSEWMQ